MPLLIVQLFLGLIGTFHVTKTINNLFTLNKWVLFGISLIIITPYLYVSQIGNEVLTEALTYPLFLLFISNILSGFFLRNNNKLYISAAILFLLILTRGQFLFIIPISILMMVYLAFKNNSIKKYGLIIIVFFLIPFVSNFVDKTYHRIRFGYLVSTPWTGIHTATLPFFVSDEEDYKIFKIKQEQDYFKYIYSELTNAGLTLNEYKKTNPDRGYSFYAKNSTAIANFTIDAKGRQFLKIDDLNFSFISNDRMNRNITVPLIKNNLKDWFKFYIMNIVAGIGHERLLFLYPIFLLFSILRLIRSEDRLAVFIVICFLMSLSNISIVALVQPLTFYRYTTYCDFLIYTSFILLLTRVFENKSENS
jgi:hypothetical protein